MKRLLIAFFLILIAIPSHAENWIKFKSDVVEKAINQLVASENRQSAADEYQKNMDQTDGRISVTGLYKVCIASGFNIQTNDGYNLCRNFLNFMISESNFGTESATQKNCANLFNGVWTLSSDGKQYQCVGRDGYLLVYKKSCRDGGGTCIKQFAGLKTQGSNGREFINAYGKLHGLNLTCHADADISTFGQDYIRCSAAGKAYEFEFDSLNQTPNSTSSSSENTAICELYGGKIVNTGDKYTEDIWQSCDISSELCKGVVSSLAQRTGHSVQYHGYCRLSRGIKEVSTIFLNQIDGIDSRMFYNAGLQMRMDTAKPMVEEYLRTKFPNDSYIVCDATPKILNEGLGTDKDYVVSCTVGSQQVDFVFDDISETFDSDAATGMEAMQCIINGGTFKGESCRGPTKEECEKLDAVLRSKGSDKGARYDDEARACILGNAEATYKRDVAVGYITGAVVIVGGAFFTIVTGGAAAPVIINGVALLAADIGINYVMDANHQRLTNKAAKKFVNFVTDADACTTEQCALDVLEKHYATLSGVMSDLNTDDQAVVDETMDRLIGLIQTEFVACGENESGQTVYANPADCAMQQSHLKLMDYIDPVSEPVLIIGSIAYNPGYVTNKFMKLKKVSKLAKLDDVADGINYDKKLRAAYQQYAPKNQSFDDFKKMFANEAEFDKAVAGWKTFEPGYVRMGDKEYDPVVYVSSPYSTYDPELAKQMRAIEADYADDIADVNSQIELVKAERKKLDDARRAVYHTERDKIIDEASTKLGRRPRSKDWESPELQDLQQQMNKLQKSYYSHIPETPEEIALIEKQEGLENILEGYIIARDYEKAKIINASIPEEIADAVTTTRRQEIADIVAKDDDLFAQYQRFSNMSVDEKRVFLQTVHDKLDEQTNVRGLFTDVYVYEDPDSYVLANAARQYNVNSAIGKPSASFISETVVHEQSHLIDSQAPDLGMLGSQKASVKIYNYNHKPITVDTEINDVVWDWEKMQPIEKEYLSIEGVDVYETKPTEYSSFKVGKHDGGIEKQISERRAEMQ
ncbi:MAG TPA: hypothetical protein IAC63_00870 [Candidatus Enterousia avicola]|uniref:Uncharacterized protein n=1 Tax=Candidatus Enterousia avicola TaxID=2840787 RepID=A0A9D1MRW3_9PROT|nr:hypothetical protein [Candidatus Enterousia avicola]